MTRFVLGKGHRMWYNAGRVKRCQICGKPATVFLTQIADGKLRDVALCRECAKQRGIFDPNQLSLASQFFPKELSGHIEQLIRQMLNGEGGDEGAGSLGTVFALNNEEDKKKERSGVVKECPECGYPLSEYKRTHKLGCPACYAAFRETLEAEEDEDGAEGTVMSERAETREELEERLRAAVERENYEEAARIRDRIKRMPKT